MAKRSAARKPAPPRPAPPRPIQRRSSGRQTRAEIVAAAERHFAERGEAARLEDIAADVGIRRAAIFHYFRDKDELYAAVLDEVFQAGMATLPGHGGVVERLEASLLGWIDYVARRPTVARLILREAASAQPGAPSPLAQRARAPVERFRSMIDAGLASGEPTPLSHPHRLLRPLRAPLALPFPALPRLPPPP